MKIYRVTKTDVNGRKTYRLWQSWQSAINSAAAHGGYQVNVVEVVDVADDAWGPVDRIRERYARGARNGFFALVHSDRAQAQQLLEEFAAMVQDAKPLEVRMNEVLEEDAKREVQFLLGTTFGS